MRQQPFEEAGIDVDRVAVEQIARNEPDQLDGPAANLDRTLDDENPDGENT